MAQSAIAAQLYESKRGADAVVVFTKGSVADVRDAVKKHMQGPATPPVWPEECTVLEAHIFPLSTASNLFYKQLHGDSAEFALDKGLRVYTFDGREQHVLIVSVPQPGCLELADTLVRSMYTGQLMEEVKADAEQLLLLWMMADGVEAPIIQRACADALTALPDDQLSAGVVGRVFTLLTSTSLGDSAELKQLLAKCEARVVDLFKDVHGVLANEQLMAVFTGLPFAAVKAWAASDALRVDSENMVLRMLCTWVSAQSGLSEESVLASQMSQLSALVRVSQLTPTYLMSALQLDWFQPRGKLFGLAAAHTSGMLQQLDSNSMARAGWPDAWSTTKPRTAAQPRMHVDWSVPAEQVAQLISDAKTTSVSSLVRLHSKSCCITGFDLSMELTGTHKEEGTVQLGLFSLVKSEATGAVPIAVNCMLSAQQAGGGARSYSHHQRATSLHTNGESWGWRDYFDKGPISCIDQLSDFIVDGHLKLRCTLMGGC